MKCRSALIILPDLSLYLCVTPKALLYGSRSQHRAFHSFPGGCFLALTGLYHFPQSWKFPFRHEILPLWTYGTEQMGYHTGKFIDGLFQSNDRPVWDMLHACPRGDVAQRLAAGKWRKLRPQRAYQGSAKRRCCESQGRHRGEPAKMNTELIPNTTIR